MILLTDVKLDSTVLAMMMRIPSDASDPSDNNDAIILPYKRN